VRPSDVPIDLPCPADFDSMPTEAAGRLLYCAQCDKNVHDLSAMEDSEARAFVSRNDSASLCVTYTLNAADEIEFRRPRKPPAPEALVPVSRLLRGFAPVRGFAPAAGAALLLAACTPHASAEPESELEVPARGETEPPTIPLAPPVAIEDAGKRKRFGGAKRPRTRPTRVVGEWG
jgi:hypothetical protein